jgi:hypothetical protein
MNLSWLDTNKARPEFAAMPFRSDEFLQDSEAGSLHFGSVTDG